MHSKKSETFTQWYTVGALMLIYIFALIDRQIISLLIGDIKNDLSLDDFQAGLLMGPAFGVLYIIGGPLFGILVDKISRKKVLTIGLSIWSIATIACGLSSSFVQLVFARMFVGAGEASVAPSSYSLISDIFPKKRIATALSIFAIGGTVGGGMALLIGGLLLNIIGGDSINVPYIGPLQNWQIVFIATGAPGIILLLIVWSLKEPRLHLQEGLQKKPLALTDDIDLKSFFNNHKFLLGCHFSAFCLAGIVAYSIFSWTPEYLIRNFDWPRSKVGIALGTIGIITSILSHVISGLTIDYYYSRGMKDAHFRIYLYMLIIALPCMATTYFLSSPYFFLAGYFALSSLAIPFTAFASSSLQLITPPHHRGKMSGIFLAALGFVGLSIGPSLVGFVTKYILGDEAKLGLSISLVGTIGTILIIIILFMGLKPLRLALSESTAR